MGNVKRMLTAIKVALPGLTAREWGAIAIEASRKAGLCEPDVSSLRTNLQNEWAIATAEHGDRHHDRTAPRTPRATAQRGTSGGC
ncbi:MAG TPA: hypothetical protein VF516_30555 [Kofleriaceae bacterium]